MTHFSQFFSPNRKGYCLALVFGFALTGLGACASTPRGASDAHLAQAKSNAPEGAQLFEQQCAKCHGDRGQGLAGGPAIIGPGALPEFPSASSGNPQMSDPGQVQTQKLTQVTGAASREAFRTAADVYRYISTRMPLPSQKAGSLAADEYWKILDFILISHGTSVPSGGVNESNAASVPLPQ